MIWRRFNLLRQTTNFIVPTLLGLAYARLAEVAALDGVLGTFMGQVSIQIAVASTFGHCLPSACTAACLLLAVYQTLLEFLSCGRISAFTARQLVTLANADFVCVCTFIGG